jgi:ATP-binding cassette, subfamily B (MDR/TAP), member 1
MMFGSFAAG